jgi:hypothetical protein
MPSGSDSSDSRYDSALPEPRNRAGGTVALTYTGLSINLLTLLAALVGVPLAGWAGLALLPLLALPLITALTVNVLAFVFGRLAARSEMPADGKAACRVCVVVALLQALTALTVTVAGGAMWYFSQRVSQPNTTPTTPAVQVDAPFAVDERPTVESRPTVRQKGE